jgi:hypothetical protein
MKLADSSDIDGTIFLYRGKDVVLSVNVCDENGVNWLKRQLALLAFNIILWIGVEK